VVISQCVTMMSRGGHQVVLVDLHEVLLPGCPSGVLQVPRVRFIKLRLLKHREAVGQCVFSDACHDGTKVSRSLRDLCLRSYICSLW